MLVPCIKCFKPIDSRAKHKKCKKCCIEDGNLRPNEDTRNKMRQIKLENPTKYWLGKKRADMVGHKWNNGRRPWNKGLPWSEEAKEKFRLAGKGKHYSPETEFKKGTVPVHKGVFGDTVCSVHNWIKATASPDRVCEMCGSLDHLEWSNKSHKYKKDTSDWQFICRRCHMQYDKETFGTRRGGVCASQLKSHSQLLHF